MRNHFLKNRKGILFVISSPSGGGKTAIAEQACKKLPKVMRSISYTTRPPRKEEIEGKDYYFVDKVTFDNLAAKNHFIENATVFEHQYGTTLQQVQNSIQTGNDLLLTIDGQGARILRKRFKQINANNLVVPLITIFIVPPSVSELARRLSFRGDDEQKAQIRMMQSVEQISYYPEYDYVIINQDLDVAVEDCVAIIQAERFRTAYNKQIYESLTEKILTT